MSSWSENSFWGSLGNPKFICAPMVDNSELAFRSLCEDHGCQLGYTPMMHAGLMARDEKYRADMIKDNYEVEEMNKEYVDLYQPSINVKPYDYDSKYDISPDRMADRDKPFLHRLNRKRPVITQICANVGDTALAGAKTVERYSDAIDLNFGCPQDIARRVCFNCTFIRYIIRVIMALIY